MRAAHCTHERAVQEAMSSGGLDGELRRHVAECPSCADLALVQAFLACHTGDVRAQSSLPDPGAIWWRARMRSRAEAAERATWMIPALQRLALVCTVVLPGLFVIRSWPAVKTWLSTLIPDSLLASGAASPTLVILGSVGMLMLLALFDFTHVRE